MPRPFLVGGNNLCRRRVPFVYYAYTHTTHTTGAGRQSRRLPVTHSREPHIPMWILNTYYHIIIEYPWHGFIPFLITETSQIRRKWEWQINHGSCFSHWRINDSVGECWSACIYYALRCSHACSAVYVGHLSLPIFVWGAHVIYRMFLSISMILSQILLGLI